MVEHRIDGQEAVEARGEAVVGRDEAAAREARRDVAGLVDQRPDARAVPGARDRDVIDRPSGHLGDAAPGLGELVARLVVVELAQDAVRERVRLDRDAAVAELDHLLDGVTGGEAPAALVQACHREAARVLRRLAPADLTPVAPPPRAA